MEYDRPRLDSLLLTVTNALKTCEKNIIFYQGKVSCVTWVHFIIVVCVTGGLVYVKLAPSAKPQGRVSASGIAWAGDQSGLK